MLLLPSSDIVEPPHNLSDFVTCPSVVTSALVVDDEEVYLKEDLGDVQCFDIGTNRWHRISFIPCGECSYVQASLLKVPKSLLITSD